MVLCDPSVVCSDLSWLVGLGALCRWLAEFRLERNQTRKINFGSVEREKKCSGHSI